MQCMLCGKELGQSDFHDVFIGGDLICHQCRSLWIPNKTTYKLQGYPLKCLYQYNEAFSSCLIQYKECGDEALKDVFLYTYAKKIKRWYRGYTMCLMPSTEEKLHSRGFSHLKEMFQCVGLPILEPFYKLEDTTQKKQNYFQRKEMEHQIYLREDILLPHKILLSDDVITTGSTLRGALSALPNTGHQIKVLTVAARIPKQKQINGCEWE